MQQPDIITENFVIHNNIEELLEFTKATTDRVEVVQVSMTPNVQCFPGGPTPGPQPSGSAYGANHTYSMRRDPVFRLFMVSNPKVDAISLMQDVTHVLSGYFNARVGIIIANYGFEYKPQRRNIPEWLRELQDNVPDEE